MNDTFTGPLSLSTLNDRLIHMKSTLFLDFVRVPPRAEPGPETFKFSELYCIKKSSWSLLETLFTLVFTLKIHSSFEARFCSLLKTISMLTKNSFLFGIRKKVFPSDF